VLSDDTAFLTGATAPEFADGILAALRDQARAERIGQRARELANTKYSYEAYLDRTRRACAILAPAEASGRPVQGVEEPKNAKDVA
jgi:hypothetical protein